MKSLVSRIRAVILVAALAVALGATAAQAERAARPGTSGTSRVWTMSNGVKVQTSRTPWHGGKSAEWQRRTTGKSGASATGKQTS